VRSPLAVVYWKEVRDALRDRRTAMMVFVASIVTGPLTLVLMAQFISGLEEKAAILKVRISGAEHAPALVNFFQRNDVEIEAAPADYEKKIREGRLDAVIVVPDDFDERYIAGDTAKLEIVYDDSRADSSPAIRQAERLLRAFNRESGTLRMVARGVSPDLVEPVKVEHVNTATPRQKGAFMLFLIPMFAILSPLLGGMTLAIDSTAGERERGSLEPLLTTPVSRGSLVTGKWLAAWTFASTGRDSHADGVRGRVDALCAEEDRSDPHFRLARARAVHRDHGAVRGHDLGAADADLHLRALVPGSTDVRELPRHRGLVRAGDRALLRVEGCALAARDPVLGQQMVLSRVLRGDVLSLADYLLPSGVAFALAALCVASVARLLQQERIVFGRT
jgi:sodium transport system permease protein